jgi:hypothetical protein
MTHHHNDAVEFDPPDKNDPSARNDLAYVADTTTAQPANSSPTSRRSPKGPGRPSRTHARSNRPPARSAGSKPSAPQPVSSARSSVARSPTLSPKAPRTSRASTSNAT